MKIFIDAGTHNIWVNPKEIQANRPHPKVNDWLVYQKRPYVIAKIELTYFDCIIWLRKAQTLTD